MFYLLLSQKLYQIIVNNRVCDEFRRIKNYSLFIFIINRDYKIRISFNWIDLSVEIIRQRLVNKKVKDITKNKKIV